MSVTDRLDSILGKIASDTAEAYSGVLSRARRKDRVLRISVIDSQDMRVPKTDIANEHFLLLGMAWSESLLATSGLI